jgi:uncharacterized protein (DUF849 family)
MITVAPVARVSNPDDGVINPLKPEEIAVEVFECAKAGTSQVHLHVRMDNDEITHLTNVYSRTLDMIREKSVLVKKMAQLIEVMGYEVMSTAEAHELYGAK